MVDFFYLVTAAAYALAFFSIMQHAIVHSEWLVHGCTALASAALFLYFLLLAFHFPAILALHEPGDIALPIGIALILANGQLKKWTQRLYRRSSS